jgi:hypothetical protein
MRTIRRRFWIEIVAAIACGLLAIVTVFWRDWIELSGWDPDNHNGSVEWLLVAGLAVLSVVAGVLARSEWHRPALAT